MRQHPKGRGGMVFITIEDETDTTQIFVRPEVFKRCYRALESRPVLIISEIERWNGESVINVRSARAINTGLTMPKGHNWH